MDKQIKKLEIFCLVTKSNIIMDNEKIVSLNYEAQSLFNDEVNWRNKASQSLADKLEKHDLSIKDTIGLRLQSRLTKEQAKFVSKCRSVHRDISLNF